MVPKLLVRSQIEDKKWDLLIQQSKQRVVYGYSWYLDIVCENWSALVLISGDDFQVVMPLPFKRKLGFKVLQQPLFCQYLGLFSPFDLQAEVAEVFCRCLSSHFSFISSYNFSPQNFKVIEPLLSRFPLLKFDIYHTLYLKLNDSVEAIQTGYSSQRILNLEQSKKFGWEVLISGDILRIINLFRSHHAVNINGGVSESAYTILMKLYKKLLEKDCAELWYAQSGGYIHAGCLFVKEGNMGIYLFNSANETGRKGNARTYLIDRYLTNNIKTMDVFDFESPESERVSSFYEQFGADKVPFLTIRKNDLPFPFKQIQQLRRRFLTKTKPGLFSNLYKI